MNYLLFAVTAVTAVTVEETVTQYTDDTPAIGHVAGLPEHDSTLGQSRHELFGGARVVDQLADVPAGGAQGLQGRDPHQRLAAQVEDDRVPRRRGDLGGVPLQAPPAEVGAGVLRRG